MRPIGIFGGTFDPIHIGHLRAALELREALDLAQVRFVPSAVPPHRQPPQLAADTRLALIEAAVAECPGFTVDTCELTRTGPSYMVDTLTDLRRRLSPTPLCLLLGTDAFLGLPDWHRGDEILRIAHVVVAHRPGWEVPAGWPGLRTLGGRCVGDAGLLASATAGYIYFQNITALDVSATQIRELAMAGRSLRYLVPEPVRQLLEGERVYRSHAK